MRGSAQWTYARTGLLDLEMGARMQSPQMVASRFTQRPPRAFHGVLWGQTRNRLRTKLCKFLLILRAVRISKVDLVLPSGPTGTDPLQTRFFQLLGMRTKMVGPGASEIVLYLATVALADRASVFVASDTGAITVSPTGGIALVRPVIFSVVALDLEEPIEDLLFPDVGSTSDVSSDIAFSFNESIAASTTGSKMVRVTACGVKVAIPSGQSDRVLVLAPGSSVPVDPTADFRGRSGSAESACSTAAPSSASNSSTKRPSSASSSSFASSSAASQRPRFRHPQPQD